MTNEVTQFKYDQLDGDTAQFLRTKETNMREIVGKAYTELGRELTEAQERLAGSRYDGVFVKWYESVGFKRDAVYRLINRYALFAKCESGEQSLLEDLPVSLTYDISAPSAESTPAKAQAKAEVLAGDITTGKAYKERIAQIERERDAERKERERLEEENSELADKMDKPPEVIEREVVKTEYIEVDNTPEDYDDVKQRLEEYRDKFGDLENYDENITATHRQDMIVAVMSFSQGVREFIKRYEYMTRYKTVIDNLDVSHKTQYDEAVNALKGMAQGFEFTEQSGEIIDMAYEEVK